MLNIAIRPCAWLLSPAALMTLSSLSLADEAERSSINMPKGVTPVSLDIYGLHMDIFWWCVAIGIVVFGVMFYSMIVHRKSNGAKAANFHESTVLEVLWTVIPFAILIIMAWPATKSLIKLYDASESDIDIVVTGYQWKWKYEYFGQEVSFFSNLSTPQDQIQNLAPKGEHYLLEVDEHLVVPIKKKIRFLITSNDVIHAWWVPSLAVKKDAVPGYVNESWAYIEEPGIYRGVCAELCGKDHGFMPIVVEAVDDATYNTWLADRREAAKQLKALAKQTFTLDELIVRGEKVYGTACMACHGANGEGGVGKAIAGSPIANGPLAEHLDMVVNGSQQNALMAAFGGQLSEVDLAAVITFQRNRFGNSAGDLVQPVDVLKFKQGK